MGTQLGEAEDFGIGVVAAQTDELCDKFSTGESGLDDVALSEVRHKAVAHKASSVLTSVFIDENIFDDFHFFQEFENLRIGPRPWFKARAKP